MVDVDTFLTTLYVIVDDFCQSRAPRKRPAPKAALSDSEVIALAIFARWGPFSSERDFFRYAQSHLREAFSPPCPIARSSIGWCAPRAWASSRRWPCTCWRLCRMPKEEEEEEEPTKLWMLRPCPFGTRSEGARDG
jgi:hypothetical protein